jgi:hypothetical protein
MRLGFWELRVRMGFDGGERELTSESWKWTRLLKVSNRSTIVLSKYVSQIRDNMTHRRPTEDSPPPSTRTKEPRKRGTTATVSSKRRPTVV